MMFCYASKDIRKHVRLWHNLFPNKIVPALEASLLYEITRQSFISRRPHVAVDISTATPRVFRSVEKSPWILPGFRAMERETRRRN